MASNWVTLQDLVDKTAGADSFKFQNSMGMFLPAYQNVGLNKNEGGALGYLYMQAQEVLRNFGIQPDKTITYLDQSSDVPEKRTFSYYSMPLVLSELDKRNSELAYDPSRQQGNWGSSKGFTAHFGVLQKDTGNVINEFVKDEGSLLSDTLKGAAFIASGILGAASLAGAGVASSIGSTIAAGAPPAVQTAIGSAVTSGAITALSGGDAEDVIKNALIGGATGAASELVKPYIQDAIDFVKDLTPEGLQDVVAAAGDAEDVAGNVADVDVSPGEFFDNPFYGDELLPPTNLDNAYASMSDYGRTVYDAEIALGATPETALIRAYKADALNFPTTGNALATGATAPTTTPANALTGTAITPEVADAMLENNLTTPTAVAPPSGVATVDLTGAQAPYDPYTGLAENFPTTTPPIIPPTTTAGLGAAGTAAGVAGAGAAAGTVGGGITATLGAGLDLSAGAGEPPAGGRTSTVVGGTGITPDTVSNVGLDTSNLALGGALGAGAAAGSALPVGSAAAAGSALGAETAATGLTGIPVVDDFLKYLGTPAGAAALGAFGSLAGGYLTGQAAKDAAQIQADAAANALKLQREQFEYQKELLDPYRRRGEAALNRLAGVMGLDGQPAQPQQLLEMDPGYAFRLGEGMKALERVQAARGNMLSGGAIKAGQRYAQDFASGEYGNAYNRLANIAGLGQTVGGQLGTAAQQFGQTAGETMSQSANALAAGRINRTSGYMGGIGGAVGAYQNYQNQQQQNQLFGRFMDIYGRAVGAGG